MTELTTSQRLTFETGILAGRLQAFLDRVFADGNRGREGREFLHSAYTASAGDQPLDSFDRDPGSRTQATNQPLDRLRRAFALTPLEIELVLLAGMPDAHEGFAAVFRTLHPRGDPRPTAALAAQVLCDNGAGRDGLRELLESGKATNTGVLRLHGDAPFFERSLELAPGLWSALNGVPSWPPALPYEHVDIVITGLEEWLGSPAAERAGAAIAARRPCTVLVTGETDDLAFHRAVALVAHAGRSPAGFAWPSAPDRALEQTLAVHTVARDVVAVVRMAAQDPVATPEPPSFTFLDDVAVLAARTGSVAIRSPRGLLAIAADRLATRSRRRMWSTLLPALGAESAALAARFPLEPAAAAAIAGDLSTLQATTGRQPTLADAGAAIRARAGLGLGGGVRLISPKVGWSDLVVPADRLAQLREACARLQFQDRVLDDWGFLGDRPGARGVRLLFAGQPGTGKTLAAEVMAGALSADLLYVDISRVVSKWIGETEKNLAAVFETAERAQAVLFFDEADALFGKRTEVSDAHDRYANLETAYLLARLERFDGLAILATNLRQNIDPAFVRRLEFSIDFEAPDRDERLMLWRLHVPHTAPLAADVDLRELAAHPVVGAFIRNAAVAAAFLGAQDGEIRRAHFLHAIRREYEKAGRAYPTSAPRAAHA